MTPERFRKIREIYEAAVQSGEALPVYLNQVCGDNVDLRAEVEKLLALREQARDFIPHPAHADATAFGEWRSAGIAEDTRIGPYRIARELGRGGMGIVYL